MTDKTPNKKLYRAVHIGLSAVWFGWAFYRFSVNPLVDDDFERAFVRVVLFVGTSLLIAFFGMNVLTPKPGDA